MLSLIAEIAMTVFGIITLIKGKFSLTQNRVVKGSPAYVIGIILTATFPMILGLGFLLGITMAVYAHGQTPDMQQIRMISFFLEIGCVLVILLIVLAIALISSEKIE